MPRAYLKKAFCKMYVTICRNIFYNPFLTKGFTYEINHYHPGSQC